MEQINTLIELLGAGFMFTGLIVAKLKNKKNTILIMFIMTAYLIMLSII